MKRLKELRTEKGLSQARLAARAELDPSTVNQVESGAREASPSTLRKLADALEISLYELLEEEGPKAQAADLDRLPPMARRTLQRLLRAKEDPDTYWDVQDIIGMREEFKRLGISNEAFVAWFEQATLADLDAPEEEEEEQRRATPGQTARALMSK
jgi:transcriptional regulator with XRE-family HTH domain